MKNVIAYGHALLKDTIQKDDLVIDMTAGNGNDTLFLAKLSDHVIAFDVLDEAIQKTKERLDSHHITHVLLINDTHANVRNYIKTAPKAIIFNFGYLPGFDHSFTTMTDTSLKALEESLMILKEEGIIVMTLYPGHLEGKKEALAITRYVEQLNPNHYTVSVYKILNRALAPFNITIYKHKGVSL